MHRLKLILTTGANLAIGSKFEFSIEFEVEADVSLLGDSIASKKVFNDNSLFWKKYVNSHQH